MFSEKINLLKAFAIMLVVSGHLEFSILGMFPPYSFQLALFFFISGMLFKDKYLSDVVGYIKRRIKTLLLPYFIYEIFYIIVTWLVYRFSGKWWGETLTVKSLLLTPFLNGHQLDLCCPLWFVPQLFLTMITFLFVMKFLFKITENKYIHLVVFSIFGFLSIPTIKLTGLTDISLLIFRTVFSLFFVYLGYFYMHHIKDKFNIFTTKWLGVVIIFQAILWMFNRDYNPSHGIGLSYVLVWARFDDQMIVPVLTSLTGIWASLFTVNLVYPYFKNVKFLKIMGETTYHIMANHLLVMYLITATFFAIHGIPITERAEHDIYWIYNPVQTTYLYFVLTMTITTYTGFLLKQAQAKLFSNLQNSKV